MDNADWQTIHVEAKLENLATLREFVSDAATSIGLDDVEINALMLAVDEAATNIIVHGYGRSGQGSIEMSIAADNDRFVIRLRDNAPHFDPTDVPEPDLDLPLEQRPLGGMGVFIMHRAVDDLRYHPLPSGNELVMTRYLANE